VEAIAQLLVALDEAAADRRSEVVRRPRRRSARLAA
jgi:hypothetical protein